MKKAIPDEILLQVEKPARYVGREVNMVKKDPKNVDIRFAFCFPDIYEVGMSHLGLQILYYFLNRREDTYCERAFSPWTDLEEKMRENNIPMFALESQEPLKNFFKGSFYSFLIQFPLAAKPLRSAGTSSTAPWPQPVNFGKNQWMAGSNPSRPILNEDNRDAPPLPPPP